MCSLCSAGQYKDGSFCQHCHDRTSALQAIERLESLLKSGQSNAAARPPISPSRRTSPAAAAANNVDSVSSSSSSATESPAANGSHAGGQDAHSAGAASQVDTGRSSTQDSAAQGNTKQRSEQSLHGSGSLGQSKPSLAGGQDALQHACDRLNAEDAATAGASSSPAEQQSSASRPEPGTGVSDASQISRLEQMLEQQGQQLTALQSAVHRLKPPKHGNNPDASKDILTTPDGTKWVKEDVAGALARLSLASLALCGTVLAFCLYRRS